MKGKSKIAVLGVLVVFVAALAVTVLQVSASTAGAPAGQDYWVPDSDTGYNLTTGTWSCTDVANARFIFLGKKFSGDFCGGTASGKGQGMVIVYPGEGCPAVITNVISSNGESPGTRVTSITRTDTKCTDTPQHSDLGVIGTYIGTSE